MYLVKLLFPWETMSIMRKTETNPFDVRAVSPILHIKPNFDALQIWKMQLSLVRQILYPLPIYRR